MVHQDIKISHSMLININTAVITAEFNRKALILQMAVIISHMELKTVNWDINNLNMIIAALAIKITGLFLYFNAECF